MRSCWYGVLFVAATAITVPASASSAAAPPATAVASAPGRPAASPSAAAESAVTIAKYGFNGRRSGSILDESGRGHTLTVISAHGGGVRPIAHGPGSALAFPAKCDTNPCPHVALQSPTSADLNPGTRNIAYGADVLLDPGQTGKGENIVQKGYSATSSQWKLQIDGVAGRPSCVLVDDKTPTIRMARSSATAADGRWHSVQCHRIGTTFAVYIDGVPSGSTTLPARLSVTNDRPLSIGAKGAFNDNDQFNGALDNVWVQIG
jgi:hypothetical protein